MKTKRQQKRGLSTRTYCSFRNLLTKENVLKVLPDVTETELDELTGAQLEFTGDIMDDPNDIEFSATLEKDAYFISVYFYQRAKDVKDCDSLCDLDWECAGFTIDIK